MLSSVVLEPSRFPYGATAAGDLEDIAHPSPVDFVHANAVHAICDVLLEFGIDPSRVLTQAGIKIPPTGEIGAVSFTALGRLTAIGAERTRCPHFGLLVGQRNTLASLGLLGSLMRNSETVGDALRALAAHHGLLNRGAVIGITTDGKLALASYSPYQPNATGVALHCERALAAVTNVLRTLCGAQWAPEEVLLPRLQPRDTAVYKAFFRAPVRFEQEIAALVFSKALLKQRIDGGNAVARGIAERRVKQLEASIPADVTDELRQRLRATMTEKQLSAQQVARMMAIHRRTLSRRLKAEGTNFRSVANETRFGIAKQLLADTNMSLAQVAAALEFSEPAAFTHAFRRWTGTTPSAWRLEHRSEVRP